jgi:glycosyltransferase involved in cell wall biosynthesis
MLPAQEEGKDHRSKPARALRALHVLRSDHGTHVGGDLVQLASTVEALKQLGVDAISSTVDEGPEDVDLVHFYNVMRPTALVSDLRRARRKWPSVPFVLSPIYWPPQALAMLRSRRGATVRAIKQMIKDLIWWPAIRSRLSQFDLVMPNAPSESAILARHFRVVADHRWSVVPNGVWLDRWRWLRQTDRADDLRKIGLDPELPTIIGCVARVEPRKNQLVLFDALKQLDDVGLILIGPDGERSYADAVRDAAQLMKGRVALTGPLSAPEVHSILGLCDMHVLPAFYETPGLASLEAAAVGCEIVTTRIGTAADYFGDTAHYIEPWSVASIVSALSTAQKAPQQPGTSERVRDYDWSKAGRALVRAYATLKLV